jgi:hypothetical protein
MNGLLKWVLITTTVLSSVLGAFGMVLELVVAPIRGRVERLEAEVSSTRALSARRGQELIDLRAAQRHLEDEIAKLHPRMP